MMNNKKIKELMLYYDEYLEKGVVDPRTVEAIDLNLKASIAIALNRIADSLASLKK